MKKTSTPVRRQEVVPFARRAFAFCAVFPCLCLCIVAGFSIGATEGGNAAGVGEISTASSVVLSPSWFLEDGSFIRRREEKIAVLSPDNLRKIQRLIGERNTLRADMAALGRLSAEKAEAIRGMDARFANEYGIRQDRRYSYDADKMTLFFVSADPRHGGTAEKPALLPHRVFPTDEEAAAFLALMKAKDEAINARNVFETALLGRREAYRAVLANMQAGFNLSLDRAYRLEPETRSVYMQYVAPPTPAPPTPEEIAAKKAAEAEAERLEREEARKKADDLREEARRLAEEKKKLAAEETEAARERDEAIRRVEQQLAEISAREAERAKAEEKARVEAEKMAKKAAEAEAKAKAEAEKKARIAAEKKAKDEAAAKELANKLAAEKAYKTELEAAVKKLEASRGAELAAARKNLVAALNGKTKAEGALAEAKRSLAWAKDNKRSDLIAQYKKAVAEADNSVDAAQDAISSAEKQVRNAEKAMARIKDNAEFEIKTAKKEAEAKARAEAEAKAAAEKKAKAEAERKARIEAEAKAAAEKKARAEAETKARAEAEAERKAAADEKAKAIAAEKALLASRAQALTAKYTAAHATAVGAVKAADAKTIEARQAIAAARAKYEKIRGDKTSTDEQRDAARAGIVFAENQLKMAEKDCEKARRVVADVQDSISRIEKDVRKAYADELRAQGRKPLTYSTGFFGF